VKPGRDRIDSLPKPYLWIHLAQTGGIAVVKTFMQQHLANDQLGVRYEMVPDSSRVRVGSLPFLCALEVVLHRNATQQLTLVPAFVLLSPPSSDHTVGQDQSGCRGSGTRSSSVRIRSVVASGSPASTECHILRYHAAQTCGSRLVDISAAFPSESSTRGKVVMNACARRGWGRESVCARHVERSRELGAGRGGEGGGGRL
jgi:hypothetical protein